MRRRAARLATADLLLLHDDDALPRARECIRDAEARDSGADDTHVGRDILAQRLPVGDREGVVPDGMSAHESAGLWGSGGATVSHRCFAEPAPASPISFETGVLRWRRSSAGSMLPTMSVSLLLAVFTAGLAIGAIVALASSVLLGRQRRMDRDDATGRLAELLAPLRAELERYDARLATFDRERATQYGALATRLDLVAAASDGLRDQTQQL